MPYLGSVPAANYKVVRKQTITGNGGTSYTLDYPVGNDQEIEVYVNNVRQEPGVAYTTTGTTLTMTGTVAATDTFYVVFQGKAEQTISIPEKQSDGSYSFDSGFFYIDASNNEIGIGTTTPTSNLHVIGTANVTSNVVIGGTLSVGGSNVSPVQSFRNKVINGNFDYWQRETSNTNVVSGQYVADRWSTLRIGSTANVSRQAFTVGQTDVPNEPAYFHRTIVTSSAGAGNYCILIQRVESVRTFAGQTATLSFWAKADASKNIALEFIQYFGTGGSPSSSVTGIGVTTCALTTSWQKFTTTVALPSITGKTIGSDNNDQLQIVFWLDAGSTFNSRTNSLGQQSGTFDIAQVQLEAGSVATPFEVRPLGVELALCQRYYQKYTDGSLRIRGTGYNTTSGIEYTTILAVVMRAAPTVTILNGTNGGASTSLSAASVTSNFVSWIADPTSPATAMYYSWNFTASAEL